MLINPNLTLKSIPWVLLFVITFGILILGGVEYEIRYMRDTVGKEIPPEFPVLLASRNEDHGLYTMMVVPNKDLHKSLGKLPNHSLLVPAEMEPESNRQVTSFAQMTGESVLARFEIIWKRHSKQYLKVEMFGGGHHGQPTYVRTAWYTATRNSFEPQYFQDRWLPAYAAIFWAVPAFVANALLWLISASCLRRLRCI